MPVAYLGSGKLRNYYKGKAGGGGASLVTHATMWRRNGKLREKSKPKGAIAQCRPLPRRLNMALVASVEKEEDAKNKKIKVLDIIYCPTIECYNNSIEFHKHM